jgi:hypothetical protein
MSLIPFESKNSFALKDSIKSLCNGKARFDNDRKVWMVPAGALPELQRLDKRLSEEQQQDTKEVWGKACSQLGFKFVKKGTTEYSQVLELFKVLIKEPKEEKKEEEYDEDDVVFD